MIAAEYFTITKYPARDYYGYGYSNEAYDQDDLPPVYSFGKNNRVVYSFTGLGMPQYSYTTSKTPYQTAESVEGFRAEPRIIQITMLSNGCSREEYWLERQALIDALRPNYHRPYYQTEIFQQGQIDILTWLGFGPGTTGPDMLTIHLPTGDQFAFNVRYNDGAIFSPRNINDWQEWGFEETFELICHDPFPFNPVMKSEFLANPSSLNTYFLENNGTMHCYPVVEVFNGPGSGGPSGDLTGTSVTMSFAAGSPYQPVNVSYNPGQNQVMVLSFLPGNKRVGVVNEKLDGGTPTGLVDTLAALTDITGYVNLTKGFGFPTFAIGPWWSRTNISAPNKDWQPMKFNRDGITGLNYRVKYYERYVGI